MALTSCGVCERKYRADHRLCPYCGAASAPGTPERIGKGLVGRSKKVVEWGLVIVIGLVAANVWRIATRDTGPDPAMEALHSPQEATDQCLAAVESRFATQRPSFPGPLNVEYLQGGEYEISGTIELVDGSRRARHDVLCIAQFEATEGWDTGEILLDPN